MIEIKNIFAGWLTFKLNYGEVSQLFTVSYLNDFRDDINYLLGIGEGYEYDYEDSNIISRGILLDGEGTILKLSILKYEFDNEILVSWWLNDDIPVSMVYDYNKFVEDWKKEMDKYKDKYEIEFLISSFI